LILGPKERLWKKDIADMDYYPMMLSRRSSKRRKSSGRPEDLAGVSTCRLPTSGLINSAYTSIDTEQNAPVARGLSLHPLRGFPLLQVQWGKYFPIFLHHEQKGWSRRSPPGIT
jgi:hypothetical protein